MRRPLFADCVTCDFEEGSKAFRPTEQEAPEPAEHATAQYTSELIDVELDPIEIESNSGPLNRWPEATRDNKMKLIGPVPNFSAVGRMQTAAHEAKSKSRRRQDLQASTVNVTDAGDTDVYNTRAPEAVRVFRSTAQWKFKGKKAAVHNVDVWSIVV